MVIIIDLLWLIVRNNNNIKPFIDVKLGDKTLDYAL